MVLHLATCLGLGLGFVIVIQSMKSSSVCLLVRKQNDKRLPMDSGFFKEHCRALQLYDPVCHWWRGDGGGVDLTKLVVFI